MARNTISVNIWDDYYSDGYVPEGEIQETYAYVEEKIEHDKCREVLEIVKESIEALTNSKISMELSFYESAKVYPHLVGTEHESFLYSRWQLGFKGLSHQAREWLVEELKNLQLHYYNQLLDIYSES